MKTVKELVNQLNISKVSIYSTLKKPEFSGHIFKDEKNITVIDEFAEEILKAYYLRGQSETIKDIIADELKQDEAPPSDAGGKVDSEDNKEVKNTDIVRILQEQLQTKDDQINNLLNIVLNQQKLQGAQLLSSTPSDAPPEEPKKKRFFNKLFNL